MLNNIFCGGEVANVRNFNPFSAPRTTLHALQRKKGCSISMSPIFINTRSLLTFHCLLSKEKPPFPRSRSLMLRDGVVVP